MVFNMTALAWQAMSDRVKQTSPGDVQTVAFAHYLIVRTVVNSGYGRTVFVYGHVPVVVISGRVNIVVVSGHWLSPDVSSHWLSPDMSS